MKQINNIIQTIQSIGITVVKLTILVIAILLICKAITMVIPMFSAKAKIKKKWKEYKSGLKIESNACIHNAIDDLKLKVNEDNICIYISTKHVNHNNRPDFDDLVNDLSKDLYDVFGLSFVKETKDGVTYFKSER